MWSLLNLFAISEGLAKLSAIYRYNTESYLELDTFLMLEQSIV